MRGSVLLNHLPGMDVDAIDSSYTILYKDFTILQYPPEAFYYDGLSN